MNSLQLCRYGGRQRIDVPRIYRSERMGADREIGFDFKGQFGEAVLVCKSASRLYTVYRKSDLRARKPYITPGTAISVF